MNTPHLYSWYRCYLQRVNTGILWVDIYNCLRLSIQLFSKFSLLPYLYKPSTARVLEAPKVILVWYNALPWPVAQSVHVAYEKGEKGDVKKRHSQMLILLLLSFFFFPFLVFSTSYLEFVILTVLYPLYAAYYFIRSSRTYPGCWICCQSKPTNCCRCAMRVRDVCICANIFYCWRPELCEGCG